MGRRASRQKEKSEWTSRQGIGIPFPHQFPLVHLPGAVRQSRSLRFIVGMIVLMVIVNAIVDFQFKSISVETYQDKAELTSFFG